MVKNLPVNAGNARDVGSIPGSGRSPEVGNGNPLQYSCLGNSTDRGAWRATVHGVAESWTWTGHTHTHTQNKTVISHNSIIISTGCTARHLLVDPEFKGI